MALTQVRIFKANSEIKIIYIQTLSNECGCFKILTVFSPFVIFLSFLSRLVDQQIYLEGNKLFPEEEDVENVDVDVSISQRLYKTINSLVLTGRRRDASLRLKRDDDHVATTRSVSLPVIALLWDFLYLFFIFRLTVRGFMLL